MNALFLRRVSSDDLVNLRGRVALVTGGSSGIGYFTVQILARRGAKVYMGARNEQRAMKAISDLEREGLGDLGGSVKFLELDVSDPRLARSAADALLKIEKRLDILVNNAGIASCPFELTQDGLSHIMVTNHLSAFTLTDLLLPLMKTCAKEEGSDVRIVNLSSRTHRNPGKVKTLSGKEAYNQRFGDTPGRNLCRYGYSKLANILHIKELQRRMDEEKIPITCIAVHPGVVATAGSVQFAHSLPLGSVWAKMLPYLFLSPLEGAMTSAFAAASVAVRDDREKYKGAYLVPFGSLEEPSESVLSERLARELWETNENILSSIK